MTRKPLLIFPEPRLAPRHAPPGRSTDYQVPSFDRQRARLEPQFSRLQQAFDSQGVVLRANPGLTDVEKVLVIETVGKIDDFVKAVRKTEGLEWLAEIDEDEITADADFYVDEEHREKTISGRLYLIMSNQRGLEELLSLWERLKANPDDPRYPRGYAKFKHLFRHLKDIRPWGPADRLLETGLKELWDERVAAHEESLSVEVELWYRTSEEQRTRAIETITGYVNKARGTVLSQASLGAISYHAVLAKLPIQTVRGILNHDATSLVQCDQVMFLRPAAQSIRISREVDEQIIAGQHRTALLSTEKPVAALLDGLPLENHQYLRNRVIVDDPDGWAASYQAADRIHGTAMASLIIRGDLSQNEELIKQPIYVRPILKPEPTYQNQECMPSDQLAVDLIHRAVKRLFEGEGRDTPVADTVRIINLSIGITGRPFDRFPSPLARLLDYLSTKYHVLFLVSAGNHVDDIELDSRREDFERLARDPVQLQKEIWTALAKKSRHRRLLSPSEAINALTVGASHEDGSTLPVLLGVVNPCHNNGFPSPINAHGLGFRRAIKPEIFFPGGRQIYRAKIGSHPKATLQRVGSRQAPGHQVACPVNTGSLWYSRGTSNATALATRAAIKINDVLEEIAVSPDGRRLKREDFGILIKTLLVHSAGWGDLGEKLSEILNENDPNVLARLIGYGKAQIERVLSCVDQRATVIGTGSLEDGEGHLYSVPIPPSLSGRAVLKKVTATLAWFSPVSPGHSLYRNACLWFNPYESKAQNFETLLKLNRKHYQWQTVRKGTVQHEIFEGESAVSFQENESLSLQVNCRSDIGIFEQKIPYAIAVTFEVAPATRLPIYEEIRARIRPAVAVRASS